MAAARQRGRPPHPDVLTPAEWEVLDLVRHGMGNRRIAAARNTSVDAVKFHVANLLVKLGVPDRLALRAWTGAPAGSALSRRRRQMPAALNLGPIGQISRHVRDIKAAEQWYGGVLGLRHLFTFGNLAFFDCDGTRLFLSAEESENGHGEHAESILYFTVTGIDAVHDELKRRGVTFKSAPHMIHRHQDGTEEWMAFFQDPDGGVLALMERVKKAG